MRLSEAIRLGAMATRHGSGSRSIVSDDAPCALGAARLAAGIQCEVNGAFALLVDRWPVLWTKAKHPEWGHEIEVINVIWKLNDLCKWTREQIADWVEQIEQQEDLKLGALHEAERMCCQAP